MADNYLERQYEEYEKRKALWLKNKKHPKKNKNHSTNGNESAIG